MPLDEMDQKTRHIAAQDVLEGFAALEADNARIREALRLELAAFLVRQRDRAERRYTVLMRRDGRTVPR